MPVTADLAKGQKIHKTKQIHVWILSIVLKTAHSLDNKSTSVCFQYTLEIMWGSWVTDHSIIFSACTVGDPLKCPTNKNKAKKENPFTKLLECKQRGVAVFMMFCSLP